jgi:hypothetical protein
VDNLGHILGQVINFWTRVDKFNPSMDMVKNIATKFQS